MAGSRFRYFGLVTSPRIQSRFQVRFDWGLDGARVISDGAHIIVWADALTTPGAPDPLAIDGPAVIAATQGSAAAAAQWILDQQAAIGDRAIVAVVAAGTDDGRFAVEDLLAAGSVVDALSTLGIDSTSPEAAAASAAFEGLRNATLHLLSASVTGQELEAGAIAAAKEAAMSTELRILREFSLPA